MQNIFWGVLIIGIGLFAGTSVFLGDFSLLSLLFDGLGLFWIGRGGLALLRGKKNPRRREPAGTSSR
jgi:hypothetical protein